MSDEEILKISYRKPAKFGELFDKHQKRFLRVAQKTLRSGDDAEDAVQETFVRIYKYGRKFTESGGKFSSWSNTILKNCLTDQINKYKNAPTPFTNEMEAITPSLNQEEILSNGNRNYVQFVLDKIGGATAEILNLRFVLGKSFKEIAKILNIKNGAARVRVHRSKKLFMQTYKQFNNNNYE